MLFHSCRVTDSFPYKQEMSVSVNSASSAALTEIIIGPIKMSADSSFFKSTQKLGLNICSCITCYRHYSAMHCIRLIDRWAGR